MLKPGGEPDLALEAVGAERRGELREQDLQGDRAVMLEVLGQIDRSHPATSERALEHIAVAQARSQRGGPIGERGWGRDGCKMSRRTQQRQAQRPQSAG